MHYYEVAPNKIVKADSNSFTYHSEEVLSVGAIVKISIGNRELPGVVVKKRAKPDYATKSISQILDTPPLPEPLLETAIWMSEYYATHLALILQTILPQGVDKKRRKAKKTPTTYKRNRTNFLLNDDQSAALNKLSTDTDGTSILHGITGSGKTAVYINYAKEILANGRSVIVLVPEIALTSQIVADFHQEFKDVIVTHSQQTEAQRHRAWLDALTSDRPRVAIGPRSALFLPFNSVGAIILDEAHEPSFKQDKSPRYSALRVAAILAKYHKAKVVQGSATPLVSEYFIARNTKRPIIEMSKRAKPQTTPPTVKIVDMTTRQNFVQHRFLSDALLAEIKQNITGGHQTLIYHNRRGSASTTICENCGWLALCPRCFVPLTLHIDKHALICHICNHRERIPTLCPDCGETNIIHKGIGTKLIESELKKFFPKAVIARFDGDASSEDTVNARYQELYDNKIDIIIGTQVVAKGLDLPNLRTVGIVQADAGLALPDFTTRERTFQLLAQVVGRVGRDSQPTSVILQTYQPKNETIFQGVQQDYQNFYKSEIAKRRQSDFPPFTYLLKLTCIYKTESAAIKNSQKIASAIRKNHPNVIIFGPTPSFYERVRDTYRWQIVVKSTKRSQLLQIIHELPPTHWQYDIDPANLL